MLKYIIKRLLIFIPTLAAISLLTFIMSVNAPGDPVDTILNKKQGESGQGTKGLVNETAYISLRHKLGLDLPVFYFNITNATVSDTLYRIPKADVRDNFKHISFIYGSWPRVAHYYSMIQQLNAALNTQYSADTCAEYATRARTYAYLLLTNYQEDKIRDLLKKLDDCFAGNCRAIVPLTTNLHATETAAQDIFDNREPYKKYIPVIYWYGFRNQYHHWLINFLRGDFGISYQDMRPVKLIVWDAMKWTIGISLASVLLAYFIAVPAGISAAVHKGSGMEKAMTTGLFMLYSLPNFWIGTILIIFFCGGDWFSWFPAPGAAPVPGNAPVIYQVTQGIYRLILPLCCWTYTSLAFISRQMRGSMLSVMEQDYIRTAKAKGLPERKIIWKHALRNSLLPVITLFANVFPLLISGSVVIEELFSIPGMGQISYNGLLANDYPVVFTTTMFAAIFTLAGTLIADVLYVIVDPRISFSKAAA